MAKSTRVLLIFVFIIVACTCIAYSTTKKSIIQVFPSRQQFIIGGMAKAVYVFGGSSSDSQTLILSLISNGQSYGRGRNFLDYLKVIRSQTVNSGSLFSLGILTSSQQEFDYISSLADKDVMKGLFTKITILLELKNTGLDGVDRHLHELQKERRRFLASLRNTLVYSSLDEQANVLWIDADIIKIPLGTLDKMIISGLDIITPACREGTEFPDYDGNAWKGQRIHPSPEEILLLNQNNGYSFTPKEVKGKLFHISELAQEGVDFVEIDSVGGTVLFVKAEIFRKGINFPPYYVIGTDWNRIEGWDGIETEGLCYVAKASGYKCWGMPNQGNYMIDSFSH